MGAPLLNGLCAHAEANIATPIDQNRTNMLASDWLTALSLDICGRETVLKSPRGTVEFIPVTIAALFEDCTEVIEPVDAETSGFARRGAHGPRDAVDQQ